MDFEKNTRQSPPGSTKPVKPRKFRSSCDACSASKVKCGQEQPHCSRCENLGLHCNYSPSRRMGKPPASARQLSKSSNVSSSESERQNTPNPAKKRQLSPPSQINIPAPQTGNTQCIFDHSFMDTPAFTSMNWQDDVFTNLAFDGPVSADLHLTSSNIFDFNFNFTADSTDLGGQLMFGDENSLGSSSLSSQDPVYEPLQLFPSDISQSATKVSPRSSLTVPKLCTHQTDLSRTPSPTPFLEPASSIDQVLITNKAEIENAYSLLACDCSHNPHFALTLALICSRILAMYEAVIKHSPSSSSSSSSGCIGITVGAYKMDAEDEERMRLQIVVNELRKVKGLVDKYASKYCTVEGPMGDDGIYSALVQFLRSKFTTTLQDLLKRLE